MKKLLIAILLFAGSFGIANAQTTKKTVQKKETVAKSDANKTVAKTTTTHLKKDGTADKRYKENKVTKTTTTGPLKKDGTPDKRYKANKK